MPNRRRFLGSSIAVATGTAFLVPHVLGQDGQKDSEQKQDQEKKAEPKPLDAALVKQFVGASHGRIETVKELLAKEPKLANASWDWRDGDWETGLGAASHVGNRDIANFLLDNGSRIDIFAMTMLGHIEPVKTLVKSFPKIHEVPGPHGIPLLSHAIYGREQANDVFEFLLESGANPNQTSNAGSTVLMNAASTGRVEIVKQLLDKGADPNLKDSKDRTALQVAIDKKHEKVVEILKPLTKS